MAVSTPPVFPCLCAARVGAPTAIKAVLEHYIIHVGEEELCRTFMESAASRYYDTLATRMGEMRTSCVLRRVKRTSLHSIASTWAPGGQGLDGQGAQHNHVHLQAAQVSFRRAQTSCSCSPIMIVRRHCPHGKRSYL